MIYSIIRRDKLLLMIFLSTFLSFCVIIFKAGFTFSHHSYYIIPFVPVMALIAGYGLDKIKSSKIALFILILISIEGIANQQHDFRIKEKDRSILTLEKDLDKVSNRNDLILINSGLYPTPMYFSHRKGWINSNDEINNEDYIKKLRSKGLKYIVILKKCFGTEMRLTKHDMVFENDSYIIYDSEIITGRKQDGMGE